MKKLILSLALLAFALTGYSQGFSFGPKLGLSQTQLDLKSDQFKNGESKFGYHVGLFARIGLGSLYLQPEVLYTQTQGQFTFDPADAPIKEYEADFNRVDIPVMLGFKMFNFLRVQAGPIASINLNSELKDAGNTVRDVKFEDATVGYQAGLGLDIGNMIIDAKYESSLNKMSSKVGNFNTDQRVNQWILSVGFRLF
ncbi:outer membrane protein with beta-barrel domain [Algoriphagus ratkowskyi]|uniref:Outer membrane protein with beta-barrel domain n=1 Tax=Algoriphagus ratkowskyi TaxID=57028 RepID=A0A2W7RMC0_9BACT|nr:porin family protein [Algoriphagus ratkowskyi]PZX51855.1 outer membrane protein with beta-barrel domain [Algoriphagus ratkowskyi]TXD76012.1 PorT family protein [Algoriphagus ratkowskyi]